MHGRNGWTLDDCVLKIRIYKEMFNRNNILSNPVDIGSEVILRNK